jgi:hypothetical protein
VSFYRGECSFTAFIMLFGFSLPSSNHFIMHRHWAHICADLRGRIQPAFLSLVWYNSLLVERSWSGTRKDMLWLLKFSNRCRSQARWTRRHKLLEAPIRRCTHRLFAGDNSVTSPY